MTHFQFALEQKRNECIAQLQAGVALCQLAKIMKVSDSSLRKKIKQWNMKHLLKPVTDNNGAAKVNERIVSKKAEILDLRKKGMGINKLAYIFKTSNTIIVRYLNIWERPNAKHGKMITTYNRYSPKTLTEQDFAEEIKTAVYKKTKHGVSGCFPINGDCQNTVWDNYQV